MAKRSTSKRSRYSRRGKIKKKPFGGYNINFTNCTETMEDLFGSKPIPPSQMTKILWKYVKKWKLGGKN